MNLDYCYITYKSPREMKNLDPDEIKVGETEVLVSNNLGDRAIVLERMKKGESIKRIRTDLGYAGAYKKIDGEKHDDIYCKDQADALQINLGLKEHHKIEDIMKELGYKKYNWTQGANGYAIQTFWNNSEIEMAVVKNKNNYGNLRDIYFKTNDKKNFNEIENLMK